LLKLLKSTTKEHNTSLATRPDSKPMHFISGLREEETGERRRRWVSYLVRAESSEAGVSRRHRRPRRRRTAGEGRIDVNAGEEGRRGLTWASPSLNAALAQLQPESEAHQKAQTASHIANAIWTTFVHSAKVRDFCLVVLLNLMYKILPQAKFI
jgi:hypothetical protein